MDMTLKESELERYHRQLGLPGIGIEGQLRLKQSRVLVIGAGGLGSPALYYLVAAGVGHITVVDSDVVDLSNLQRQILHGTPDIGRAKVLSAADSLQALNPEVDITTMHRRFTAENGPQLVIDHDFTVSATDNFSSKYLVNDICVELSRPYSHAGIFGTSGQAMTFVPGHACLRCIFPDEPQSTTPPPILGATAGLLGSIQAAEAIKVLLGIGNPLVDRFLNVDVATMQFDTLDIGLNPGCTLHGRKAE